MRCDYKKIDYNWGGESDSRKFFSVEDALEYGNGFGGFMV